MQLGSEKNLEYGALSEISRRRETLGDNRSVASQYSMPSRQLPQIQSHSQIPEIPRINRVTGSVIQKEPANVLGETDASKYLEHMVRHQSMKNCKLTNR
jgi:hypothetical protein